ncbi:hypothetical protein [Celeribacter sp. HF31]|uniref:hypothetical protein n=1 Tax=Celeribacter sp. HF31 TaxID=2721558 RepID=UPI0034C5F06D
MGAALVVEVTQSLGAMPLDLARVQPDFMIASGYKWLLFPYGLSQFYAAPNGMTRGLWRKAGSSGQARRCSKHCLIMPRPINSARGGSIWGKRACRRFCPALWWRCGRSGIGGVKTSRRSFRRSMIGWPHP